MMTAKIGQILLAAAALAIQLAAIKAQAAVKISSQPTQNMSCSNGTCSPTAKKAVLNVTDLASMLAGGDVTVLSGNIAKDIEMDAALSWTSTSRLTLDSFHAISFNKPISVTGTGALTITTNDGGSDGDFRFFGKGHVRFWDLSSSLIINGKTYALVGKISKMGKVGTFEALARSLDVKNKTYTNFAVQSLGGTFEGLGNTISHVTVHGSEGAALVAQLEGTVRDLALLSVDMSAGDHVGAAALAASCQLPGVVANSYATGKVSVGANGDAGGLFGGSSCTVSRSRAAVTVSGGNNTIVGGLVGVAAGENNVGSIDESYATGAVSGGDGAVVGGLAGSNTGGAISNSYATGVSTGGSDALVGGLIGSNANYFGSGFLSNSYSVGAVSGGQGAVLGGLIGNDGSSDSISNTYWDLDTSGINDPSRGAGNVPNDAGITGLTDAQLKSALPPGFDKSIWAEKANVNGGYPYLLSNPPQ